MFRVHGGGIRGVLNLSSESAQFRDLAIFTKWSNSRLVKLDQWSNLTTSQI